MEKESTLANLTHNQHQKIKNADTPKKGVFFYSPLDRNRLSLNPSVEMRHFYSRFAR